MAGQPILPPEIIIHIFKLSAPANTEEELNSIQPYYRALKTYSLVSKDWKEMAQKELNTVFYFSDGGEPALFKPGHVFGAAMRHVKANGPNIKQIRLELNYFGPEAKKRLAQWEKNISMFTTSCPELEELSIEAVGIRIGLEAFAKLKKLRFLEIRENDSDVSRSKLIFGKTAIPRTHFPLLRQLTLTNITSFEAISRFISPATLPALRDLSLSCKHGYEYSSRRDNLLADSVRSVVPQLEILCLDATNSPSSVLPSNLCPTIFFMEDAETFGLVPTRFQIHGVRHIRFVDNADTKARNAYAKANRNFFDYFYDRGSDRVVHRILKTFSNLQYLELNPDRKLDFPTKMFKKGRSGVEVAFESFDRFQPSMTESFRNFLAEQERKQKEEEARLAAKSI